MKSKQEIRDAIDSIDKKLVALLGARMESALEMGALKKATGQPVLDKKREQALLGKIVGYPKGPLDPEGLKEIYETIMKVSRRLQKEVVTKGQENE